MPTTPAGAIAPFLAESETLLANSTTFQTWTESVDSSAAKTHIDFIKKVGHTRPHCLMYFQDWRLPLSGGGTVGTFAGASATIFWRFEAAVSGDNAEDEAITLYTKVGTIIDECKVLAASGAYQTVHEFSLQEPVDIVEKQEFSGSSQASYLRITIALKVGNFV